MNLLLDTSVLVDWLRASKHEEIVTSGGSWGIRLLSGIVAMELLAGTPHPREQRLLDRLLGRFAARDRILCPTVEEFSRAGRILRRLRAEGHPVTSAGFLNDVILSVQARHHGLVVATTNRRHFLPLATIIGCRVLFVDHTPPALV
ncbi:MAG: PIN domain-containing protein [Armatimonadetes bacterium]|nr:PIN domain-containing protein [Armatimonadota bacterium]